MQWPESSLSAPKTHESGLPLAKCHNLLESGGFCHVDSISRASAGAIELPGKTWSLT